MDHCSWKVCWYRWIVSYLFLEHLTHLFHCSRWIFWNCLCVWLTATALSVDSTLWALAGMRGFECILFPFVIQFEFFDEGFVSEISWFPPWYHPIFFLNRLKPSNNCKTTDKRTPLDNIKPADEGSVHFNFRKYFHTKKVAVCYVLIEMALRQIMSLVCWFLYLPIFAVWLTL